MKLVVNGLPEAPAADVLDQGEDDPFAAFTSETAPPPAPAAPVAPAWRFREWAGTLRWPAQAPRAGRLTRKALIVTLSFAILASAGFTGYNAVRARWLATPTTGLLTVTSNPIGAEVLIDGVRRGVTPLTTNIVVGAHKMTVRAGGVSKDLAITSKTNIELVQNIELGTPAPTTGALSVSSDPVGLKVAIDGKPRGVTPAVIAELSPGNHVVSLTGKGAPMERTVVIAAGATASLMISKPVEAAVAGVGSFAVTSAIEVQLFEGNNLIGSSQATRLYLPTGSHTITAVNEALGFRRSISVDVRPNETAKASLTLPNGTLSVNAQPWAEVFVDGKSIGETPIGNYALPIGTHDVVFRHPQFGERREPVTVGLGRPARVSVDLRK